MKLIDAKEIQLIDKVKSDIEIYGIPQVYANIYSEGFNAAEKQLKPLFIEFAEWLNMFVSENECGDPIYWNKDRYERKTTEELFELWMEEQTKK